MEVRTFTYKKMLNTYYLQKMFDNKKMDDHIAEMARDGWEILNSANHKGPATGIGLSGETITLTFKKG